MDIDWRDLEARVPFDRLPDFHRAFLRWRGIDPADMNLRRVQQRVEAELNRLVLEGGGERLEGNWRLKRESLEGFEQARPYLP
ncbi:hypothetical protein HNR42_002395 [Deinobacterium chartae]|uniref:Uncharacterized protein n=1 Tax=Deinobacterium chartae TaxID=521158 RepID=A0A841I3G3_9DEIO|nr:hypothetical protein [Deinobacterium chartae]MBB6098960.1 hypothetical protein [Deinobacterium chartae]